MSAKVTITQTATGWDVTVRDAESVDISTSGKEIAVDIIPDDDDHATPLDVTLEA